MPIDYELAKQLKEAGFNQYPVAEGCHIWLGSDGRVIKGSEPYPSTIKTAYRPSLSELIEACGTQFANLEREDEGPEDGGVQWIAWKTGNDDFVGTGKTPDIATARLWLALLAHTK